MTPDDAVILTKPYLEVLLMAWFQKKIKSIFHCSNPDLKNVLNIEEIDMGAFPGNFLIILE